MSLTVTVILASAVFCTFPKLIVYACSPSAVVLLAFTVILNDNRLLLIVVSATSPGAILSVVTLVRPETHQYTGPSGMPQATTSNVAVVPSLILVGPVIVADTTGLKPCPTGL